MNIKRTIYPECFLIVPSLYAIIITKSSFVSIIWKICLKVSLAFLFLFKNNTVKVCYISSLGKGQWQLCMGPLYRLSLLMVGILVVFIRLVILSTISVLIFSCVHSKNISVLIHMNHFLICNEVTVGCHKWVVKQDDDNTQ